MKGQREEKKAVIGEVSDNFIHVPIVSLQINGREKGRFTRQED